MTIHTFVTGVPSLSDAMSLDCVIVSTLCGNELFVRDFCGERYGAFLKIATLVVVDVCPNPMWTTKSRVPHGSELSVASNENPQTPAVSRSLPRQTAWLDVRKRGLLLVHFCSNTHTRAPPTRLASDR